MSPPPTVLGTVVLGALSVMIDAFSIKNDVTEQGGTLGIFFLKGDAFSMKDDVSRQGGTLRFFFLTFEVAILD